MQIKGSCFCGAVAYVVRGALHNARSCHCSMCRKAFSAQASAYAEIDPGTFAWVRGEGKATSYQSRTGSGLKFCSVCGTHLIRETVGTAQRPFARNERGAVRSGKQSHSSRTKKAPRKNGGASSNVDSGGEEFDGKMMASFAELVQCNNLTKCKLIAFVCSMMRWRNFFTTPDDVAATRRYA